MKFYQYIILFIFLGISIDTFSQDYFVYQKSTDLRYADVKPIFVNNCYRCHGSSSYYGKFTKYKNIYKKRKKILKRISNDSMPRGGKLNAQEKADLIEWLKAGAPE